MIYNHIPNNVLPINPYRVAGFLCCTSIFVAGVIIGVYYVSTEANNEPVSYPVPPPSKTPKPWHIPVPTYMSNCDFPSISNEPDTLTNFTFACTLRVRPNAMTRYIKGTGVQWDIYTDFSYAVRYLYGCAVTDPIGMHYDKYITLNRTVLSNDSISLPTTEVGACRSSRVNEADDTFIPTPSVITLSRSHKSNIQTDMVAWLVPDLYHATPPRLTNCDSGDIWVTPHAYLWLYHGNTSTTGLVLNTIYTGDQA